MNHNITCQFTQELLPLGPPLQSGSQQVRGRIRQLGGLSVRVDGSLQQVVAAQLLRQVVLCLREKHAVTDRSPTRAAAAASAGTYLSLPVARAGALRVLADQGVKRLQGLLQLPLRRRRAQWGTNGRKFRWDPLLYLLPKLLCRVDFRSDGFIQLVQQFGLLLLGWRTKRTTKEMNPRTEPNVLTVRSDFTFVLRLLGRFPYCRHTEPEHKLEPERTSSESGWGAGSYREPPECPL